MSSSTLEVEAGERPHAIRTHDLGDDLAWYRSPAGAEPTPPAESGLFCLDESLESPPPPIAEDNYGLEGEGPGSQAGVWTSPPRTLSPISVSLASSRSSPLASPTNMRHGEEATIAPLTPRCRVSALSLPPTQGHADGVVLQVVAQPMAR